MAGIYIHVPFCRQACHYCDFHFSTNTKLKAQLVDAIVKEIAQRHEYLPTKSISTIYFGGGTPSLLSKDEISKILDAIHSHFDVDRETEITLEANPDDITPDVLREWNSLGINRLSIGIQSFLDEQLKWMNRAHNAEEALRSVKSAQEAGINNITIDLIYGLPGLTMTEWEDELARVVDMEVPHVSAYCLTVESGTALGHWVAKGKEKPIDEEAANAQFLIMVDVFSRSGLEQYEVSNFGKVGFYSRHNTSYWKGVPYLGLGPSAHSFDGRNRGWNLANNPAFIKAIDAGETPFTPEKLSTTDRLNEYIMTGLRTKWGIDFQVIQERFDFDFEGQYRDVIDTIVEKGWASLTDGNLVLTRKGLFRADGIASDFFILNHED